jgi:hypothetical protein
VGVCFAARLISWNIPMPLIITCPSCGQKGAVPDKYKGLRVKCRQCAKPFLAKADDKQTPAAHLPKPTPAVLELVQEADEYEEVLQADADEVLELEEEEAIELDEGQLPKAKRKGIFGWAVPDGRGSMSRRSFKTSTTLAAVLMAFDPGSPAI